MTSGERESEEYLAVERSGGVLFLAVGRYFPGGERKASCMVVEAVAAEIVGGENPGKKRDMGLEEEGGRNLEKKKSFCLVDFRRLPAA